MKQYLIRITYDSPEYAELGTVSAVTDTFLVDGESYEDAERTLMSSVRNPSDPQNYTMDENGRLKP